MGNIAILVENLGKRYRIGLTEKRPDNFREAIRSFIRSPFRYLQTKLREPSPDEIIWALKRVSFEVKYGEVIGIIGANGAGKSTLLKILSRITEPTEGQAKIYGRVGSLLEVGTGFHPELTGRENIYLNGAILGMRRAEIARRFDEIVDFSGVEKFLDTPVKRYSSGMYVRLAFAVAAHLDPEILLVDEVLAVGDIAFQKKCLGKMDSIHQEGRTVLLVSHNMTSILQLCPRAIWLNTGKIAKHGDARTVVAQYSFDEQLPLGEVVFEPPKEKHGSVLSRAYVMDENQCIRPDIPYSTPFYIVFEYQVDFPIDDFGVGFRLYNERNIPIIQTATLDCPSLNDVVSKPGKHRAWVKLPGSWFTPGRYYADLAIGKAGQHQVLPSAFAFDITNTSVSSVGEDVLRPILDWNVV
jgi:lipopolysaccharide transport system ATP-binding protein